MTVSLNSKSGSVSGTNWTPAWAAALADIKTNGGTIAVDVDSQLETQLRISDVTGWTSYLPIVLEGDGALIKPATGITGSMMYFNSNVMALTMRGLNIVPATTSGASSAHSSGSLLDYPGNGKWVIDSCRIARAYSSGGSIIHAYGWTDLVIRDSDFASCRGGTDSGLVFADGCDALIMENVSLVDYLNVRGSAYENPGGYCSNWIRAVYSGGAPTTAHVPKVHLKNVNTDEGTRFAYIDGYRQVIIEDCSANGNAGGPHLHLKNVPNATIINFWAGYISQDLPAIKIENCGYVEVVGQQIHNGIHRIELDAATEFLRVINSPGVSVDAAAGAKYEIDGVRYQGGKVRI